MDNEQLLNNTYQNIQMVLETLPEIRNITTDCDLKAALSAQEESYQSHLSIVRQRMDESDYPVQELNDFQKNYSEWMTKLKAMTDNSTSHLAEMCIQGYTMGMIKSIQDWHKYCDASKETLTFAGQISNLHQKSIESLKKYL